MHEMAYIYSLLDIIRQEIKTKSIKTVYSMDLEIGRYHGMVEEILQMAFEAARTELPETENAELNILFRDIELNCSSCGHYYSPKQDRFYACPECGSTDIVFLKGKELQLLNMEVETA